VFSQGLGKVKQHLPGEIWRLLLGKPQKILSQPHKKSCSKKIFRIIMNNRLNFQGTDF
jgi:hypothetical protein